MKKVMKYTLLLALGASLFTACEKALDIEPRQSIDSETALTTREGIQAAIVSAYARLKPVSNYGRNLVAFPEALADNGRATNKSGRLVGESQNNQGAHFSHWQNSYFAINEINLILDAIPEVTGIPDTEKNLFTGQLRFLRGLYYFDLVKAYAYIPGAVVSANDKGGVPLMTRGVATVTDAVATLPSRAPIADVYEFIYEDLQNAAGLLPVNPVGFPGIANKAAAELLLSRVALYNKDYETAARMADSVISRSGSRLTVGADFVSQWRLSTHRETLFEVRYINTNENIGVNESLQTSYTTLATPGNRSVTGGFGDLVPTNTLLADLGINVENNGANTAEIVDRSPDVRNLLFEVGTTGRGVPYVECTKFIGKNGVINLDNVPVLRVAEAWLNKAEALATPGSPVFDEAAALDLLNDLLQARGLEPYADLSGNDLYEEILRQRRIEFAFEGHRFFDLKRLGRDLIKDPHYVDVEFTDFRILPPIPQREIDGNPNLQQNTGY